jgi:hypothetical protein
VREQKSGFARERQNGGSNYGLYTIGKVVYK